MGDDVIEDIGDGLIGCCRRNPVEVSSDRGTTLGQWPQIARLLSPAICRTAAWQMLGCRQALL
jgi:hypothetical protein